MEKGKPWSFTMDYETNEIVITTFVSEEKVHLRASEKDVKSMLNWFELARHMKMNKGLFEDGGEK